MEENDEEHQLEHKEGSRFRESENNP